MKFNKFFFFTVFILTTLLLGFVYSIDPYDKYGINVFGFKTKAVAMARENKFNMVEHTLKKYDAFVIGSSSAHRLNTADVEALTGHKTFNYAVQHTTPEDYLAITRHIFSKFKPKLILFQMDFYSLNKNFPTDTRFYSSPLKAYLDSNIKEVNKSLIDMDYLTLGAIADSFKVIWVNLTGKVRHLYLEDGNYHHEKPHEGPILLNQFGYDEYTIDTHRISLLNEIKKICDQHGTKLIVWSAPYSLEHIRAVEADPALKVSLNAYKAALVKIFGYIHDFTNVDVAPYNTSAYFRDSTHPERELFKLMLKRILVIDPASDSPDLFGKKI